MLGIQPGILNLILVMFASSLDRLYLDSDRMRRHAQNGSARSAYSTDDLIEEDEYVGCTVL